MASQYGGDIRYGIKFDYDKSGLNGIKTSLNEVKTIANNLLTGINPTGLNMTKTEIKNIIGSVNQLEAAFNQAFNPQLGIVNLQTFNQAIASSGMSLAQVQAQMAKLGPTGASAFNNISAQLLTTNMQLKQSSTLLHKMGETFANTIRWTVASAAINTVTTSIRKCYSYSKELDESLNNIMLVTDKSADSMERFARQANKAAKNLGATTTEYTNASLIYYQQGLNDAETAARTETTLKAANVTKQSADAVSEQLTAVWNGYKVSAQEAELYVDKLAKVAASTASDLEELSVGMSRVASAANLMGVDVDQLNAQLATIISVTREAPETIGTSLKTIFARMSDIEAGLDEETSLGEYTQGMADLGFNVLDANNKLRDMGDVIEEIGGKWGSLTREQQVSLAQTMAGTRQYSRLLSLFDNWDMYEKSLKDSASAAGFLQQQQDEYMESMEAHLNQLTTATEGLMDSLFNSDSFKDVIDVITDLVTLIDNFVQGIGGGGTVFIGLISLLTNALMPQLTNGIARIMGNSNTIKQNAINLIESQKFLNELSLTNSTTLKDMVEMKQQMLNLNHVLTDEERQIGDALIQQYAQQSDIIAQEEQRKKTLAETIRLYSGMKAGVDSNKQIETAMLASNERLKNFRREGSRVMIDAREGVSSIETNMALARQESSAAHDDVKSARRSLGQLGRYEKTPERKAAIAAKQAELDAALARERDAIQRINQGEIDLKDIDKAGVRILGQSLKDLNMPNAPEVKEAQQALNGYAKAVKETGASSQEAKDKLKAVEDAFNKIPNATSKVKKALKDFKASSDAAGNGAQTQAEKIKSLHAQMIKFANMKASIQSIITFANTLTNLSFGVTSLVNGFKAFANEDLSFMEKMSQGIMGVSMGLTMTLPMIQKAITGWQSMAKATSLYNAVQGTSLVITKTLNGEKALEELRNNMLTAEIEKQIVARKLNRDTMTAEQWAEVKKAAAQEVDNQLTKESIVLENGETISLQKNTTGIWKNIGARIAQHWWLLAIAGALVVLVGGLKLANSIYEKDAIAAEKAAKSAENAAKAFSKVNEEYENFKSNLSAYSEASLAMEDLTEGTVEYREKLLEANQAALKLINSLGLINGQDYTIRSDGMIVFDDTRWEEIQLQQLENLERAQAHNTFANTYANTMQLKANQTQFNRQYLKDVGWSDEDTGRAVATGATTVGLAGAGAGIGWKVGAAAGTAITPGAGTAIGAIIGGVVGLIIGIGGGIIDAITSGDETKEEIQALYDIADEQEKRDKDNTIFEATELENFLRSEGYDQELIDSLVANTDKLQEQIEAIEANTAAVEASIEQQTSGILEDNKYYQGLTDENKALYDKIIANELASVVAKGENDEDYKEAYDDAMDLFDWFDQDAYDAYLKAAFGDEANKYRVVDQAGYDATLQRLNDEGTWENVGEENSLTQEEVAAKIAEDTLIKAAGDETKNQELLDNLNNIRREFNAINTDLAKDEMFNIQSALASGNKISLASFTPEEILELQNTLAQNADLFGTEYAEAIQKAIDNYSVEDYEKYLEQQYESALSSTAAELDVDKEALEGYTEALMDNNKALKNNKEAAVQAAAAHISFTKGVEELQKVLDDNLEILEKWNEDSFETYEAAAKVADALEMMFGVRVDTDFVGEHLDKIKAAAEGSTSAIEELMTLTAKDYVSNLNIDDNSITEINSLIDYLSNQDIQIGATFDIDDHAGIQAMNELLMAGEMTEEEMNNIFSSIGWKPKVTYVDSGESVTSKQTQKVKRTDVSGNVTDEYTDEITTTSAIMIPQLTDEENSSGAGTSDKYNPSKANDSTVTRSHTAKSLSNSLGSLKDWDADSSKDDNKIEDERDIFHDINVEIEKLTRNYDRLTKAREKMVGGDVIDALNEELDLINQQNQAQRAKLEIAQQDAERRKNELAGYGVQFNADGTITNYNDILNQYQARANASGKDSDKEAYEKLKTGLEEYEDLLLSEIPEIQDKLTEQLDAWVEANIEKFTLDINLGIELKDIKKEWRELQSEVFGGEDNPLSQFNNALQGFTDIFDGDGDNLFEDTMDRMNMFMEEYQKIKDGGVSDIFGTDAAAALEQIEDMRSQLFDMTSELLEYIELIEESMDTLLEEISKTQEDIMSTYDMALAIIEHQINVGGILYGDNFDADVLNEEKFNKLLGKIKEEKDLYVETAKEANKLKDTLPDESDSTYNEKFREYVEKAVDANEILTDLMGDVEEALELLNTVLDNQMNKALDLFERTMTADAFEGWSTISDRWEKDQQLADVYLSTVNQEYEIQKLMNKINDDLLDKQYESLYAQQAINKFKETELAMLMEKDKLTEAEVKRANQLYELTLLQIALEEARNNKSSMKLKRDSQGNYTYQYVADNEVIAKAEQDILDKQNEIYNESVENAINNIERFNDAGANMQDQLQSLYESDNYQEYLGMLVNGETDSERFKELQGWLDESLGYIASDADYLMSSAQQSAIDNITNILKDAGFTDVDLNKLTDEQRKVLLSEGIDLQKLTALLNYNTQSIDDNLSILYDAINSSVDAYVENTRLVMDTAKTGEDTEVDYYDNLDLIKLNTDDLRLDLEEQKEKLKKELDEMSQKYETEIQPLQQTLKDFFKDGGKFKDLMDDYTKDLNTNLIEIKNAIGTGVTTLSSALGNYASAVTTAASQSNSGGTGGSSETGGSSNTEKTTEPTKDEKLADLSKGFKVNDRVSYNGKDTYNIEQVDKVTGQVLINDYLNKSDKSQWVDVSKIKDTKYDWIDLRNSKIGNNRFYNENATVFKPIAKSTSGKFVVEVSSKGVTSTYNIGDRIWIDPHSKGSGSWDWDVLKPGQEYSWWMMDFDSTFKDVDGGMSTWLKAKGFNTGGYTGQWPKGSKEGRWALLHQKELILNEQDTPKILDAVKLVREMTTGSIILDMQSRMNNLISNLENDLIGTYVKLEAAAGSMSSNNQALEQQVHIDATFPNVKDAKEIEAALNNLVNVASQYATEDK